MFYNLQNDCSLFVRNIMNKVGFLKTKQLVICMMNSIEELKNENDALFALELLQKKNYLIMSVDGYTLKRKLYADLTGDKFYDNIDTSKKEFIPFKMEKYSEKYKGIINSFWIVADMMPLSKDFYLGDNVWNYVFDVDLEDKHLLYEVAYYPSEKIDIFNEILKHTSQIPHDDTRKTLRRIVLTDDASAYKKIKKLGINGVAVIDNNNENGYCLVDKRKVEDAWSDYVSLSK